ncbi:MAG: hypothetical protein K2O69_01390 [Odoribacter sp.]|nr:hypothetical protein [Odoribacter sp.]
MSNNSIKSDLLEKLKQEHCFWSFNEDSIKEISDDILIEKTLIYLDMEEIKQLFTIYPFKKVKRVWLETLIPQGSYLYTLNRFLAWYFFKAKKPDAYIKAMETRHFNALLS